MELGEKRDEKRDEKPSTVAVVMVAGPGGGKPRRWMLGASRWISRGYDFAPCCATEVPEADARKLLAAGAPELGGRVFVRADSAEGRAALAGYPTRRGW